MQSSKHIGKIVRNHAHAIENGKVSARKRKAKGSGSSFASVPKHRAFVPMVTIWGGVFMALIMAVMPDYAIARASALTGAYLPLIAARLILALGVGLAGALLGYIIASALASYTKTKLGDDGLVSKAFKSREFEPINPVADLGSESFDAPVETPAEAPVKADFEAPVVEEAQEDSREPTLGELADRGFEMEAPEQIKNPAKNDGEWAFTRRHFKDALIESCEGATCEAAPNQEPARDAIEAHKPQPADTGFASLSAEQITPQRKPLNQNREALDLAAFSSLPDHREPAQEQPVAQDQMQPQAQAMPQAPATALEALRQKPTGDLSLVEMVERFAAALHDRQASERARFEQGQQSRDAALAEALKALTLFTENGFDQGQRAHGSASQLDQTEDELRSALSRLQGLRGAA